MLPLLSPPKVHTIDVFREGVYAPRAGRDMSPGVPPGCQDATTLKEPGAATRPSGCRPYACPPQAALEPSTSRRF